MNKPPFKARPYFPHTNRGRNSEPNITLAVNWFRSRRTLKHLAAATVILMNHVLYENQIRAHVVRARIYIDRYDRVANNIGLVTI